MGILTKNLTIGFNSDHNKMVVAENINASVESGMLTCLLGPNGAGKSTLLRTLSGAQPSLSGSVEIDGRNLLEITSAEMARLVGIVLTERPDLPNMTVLETIEMGRSPYTGFFGRLSAADHEIVEQAAEAVGIVDLCRRRMSTLSDGERQKVMIAKALAQQTSVILLDEPTAFLDFPSKVEMMQMLRRIAKEKNKAVFLSTHDLDTTLQIADALWLLDRQIGLTVGPTANLCADGSVARYFDTPLLRFDPSIKRFIISTSY